MANTITEWFGQLSKNFIETFSEELMNNVAVAIISVIGALIILAIGWIIGNIVKQVTIKIMQSTRIDRWVDEQNLAAAVGGKEISVVTGSIVKWYIILVFLTLAADALAWVPLKEFFEKLVHYVPLVLGGIIVFIAGLLLARYARNAVEATQHKLKKVGAMLTEGIIVLFSGVLALTLVLGSETMNTLRGYLDSFITPFIQAFAWVLAIVIGIHLLIGFKEDLKKLTADVKKSLK